MIRRFQKLIYTQIPEIKLNRARTGNPWLEKLFTENAPFFLSRDPSKKNRSEITRKSPIVARPNLYSRPDS